MTIKERLTKIETELKYIKKFLYLIIILSGGSGVINLI